LSFIANIHGVLSIDRYGIFVRTSLDHQADNTDIFSRGLDAPP
jgi:hypothetical protein